MYYQLSIYNVSTKVYSYTHLFQKEDEECQPQLQVDDVGIKHEGEEPAEVSQFECQHEEQAPACTSNDPQSRYVRL